MFYIFNNSTTAYANEVMENYYHVGQGDRMPFGGTLLEPTDSSLDIGSSTFKWSKGFCDTLNVYESITSDYHYKKVFSQTLSSTSADIEITGLNGDNYNYFIDVKAQTANAGTDTAYLIVNTSTQFSNVLIEDNGGAVASRIFRWVYNTNYIMVCREIPQSTGCFFCGELHLKTGQPQTYQGKASNGRFGAGSIGALYTKVTAVSRNYTNTMTALRVTGISYKAGTIISLWEIPN